MRRIKTVSAVPAGFRDYGMTNASNFRQCLLPAINTQRVRKGMGVFIYGNDAKARRVSNLPLGSPECDRTRAN